MAFAFVFALLVAPFATVQLAAAAPDPMPVIMVNSALGEDSAGPAVEHRAHRSHSMNARAETGTCADFEHRFDSTPAVTAQQNLSYGGNALELSSQNGAVTVRHATGGSFEVTLCKAADSEAALSQISVQQQGGTIITTGPKDAEWTVDMIVTVPDSRAITIKGQNGPVSFRGVNATIDASVKNGPLTFRDSHGEIKGRTVNGPLTIHGASGNIDVETHNGPLSLALDGSGWAGGELRAKVGNGPISLSVPDGYQTGISLKAANNFLVHCSGDICRDMPARQSAMEEPRAVNATLGTSPARIFIEGGNGPVSVKQGTPEKE